MVKSVTSRKACRRSFKIAQKTQQQINRFGRIPDKLWAVFLLYLPPEPPPERRGRPNVPLRKVLGGILYRLRTGCQWKAIPSEFGSGSTCHRRFQEWQRLDVFKKVWAHQLRVYDQKRGIGWNWPSLESAIIPAPLGGRKRAKIQWIAPSRAVSEMSWWIGAVSRWRWSSLLPINKIINVLTRPYIIW